MTDPELLALLRRLKHHADNHVIRAKATLVQFERAPSDQAYGWLMLNVALASAYQGAAQSFARERIEPSE
jgi:hypothetical protein